MPPRRKRTRRLPCRSVFHEQNLGSPLLVRSIGQDLVPRVPGGLIAAVPRRRSSDRAGVRVDRDPVDIEPGGTNRFDNAYDVAFFEWMRLVGHGNPFGGRHYSRWEILLLTSLTPAAKRCQRQY